MRGLNVVCWLIVCWLTTALSAPAQIYIDPSRGVDQTGGGSATNPLKTLTFAVQQVPAAGPATFYLRPGSYSTAGGEVFPIDLPDVCTVESDPALVPPGARLADWVTTPNGQTLFQVRPNTGAGAVTLRNLRITGNMLRGVHVSPRANATACFVLVEDCQIAQQRCLEVTVNVVLPVRPSIVVRRCRFTSVDSCIAVRTASTAGASVDLTVDRSVLVDGITGNLVLDGGVTGTIQATLRATHLRSPVRYGLLAASAHGAAVQTRVEHCLLYDIGNRVIGGGITNGAIYDVLGNGGVAPTHRIVNSIFARNKTDAALGAGAGYSWGNNLVTQASLGSLGGNKVGAATFANRAENDFHLAPTSLGVDGGLAQDTTLADDFDAEPRLSAHAGAAPDLGPDEVFLGAAFTSDGARPGEPYTLRTSWSASVPFALFVGSSRVPNSFGPGQLHLAGTILDVGMTGVCGASGVGEATLPVPNDATLAGLIVYWQSFGLQAPFLGANAHRCMVLLR